MVAPSIKQTWVVMGVLLNMYGQGMVLSYPSVLLPAILSPEAEIKADIHVASWIASCIGFAGIPGFLLSALLMDMYGRKVAHIVAIMPGVIGWLSIYFCPNIVTLIVGRALCGASAGATVTLGAVAIGEYSSPSNRGMFLNLKTTAVSLGSMTIHIFGHFLAWREVALIPLAPLIVALLAILTWPESPSWLASKSKFELCETSFYWLRGKSTESKKELEELIRAQKERNCHTRPTTLAENVYGFLNKFTKRDFLMPLLIMTFCGILLEFCGRHIFPAYALQIIGELAQNKTHSYYYTLGIDMIISVSALSSSLLVKVLKRRTLLFYSGFAATFVLACVCLYLGFAENGIISKDKPWIPIMLFSLYFILSNLGCTPIPLALLGEVFPLPHRGAGSAISGLLLSLLLLIGMQMTPYLLVSVKVYGTFAVFGALMAISLIVLSLILPETKDKTLQEIEDYFNFGRFRKDNINDEEVKMKMISSSN